MRRRRRRRRVYRQTTKRRKKRRRKVYSGANAVNEKDPERDRATQEEEEGVVHCENWLLLLRVRGAGVGMIRFGKKDPR